MYEDDPDDDWFTPEEVAPDLIDEAMTYLVDAGRPRLIPQALRAKIVREYELCGDTEPDGQVVFWLEPEDLLRQMAPRG
jgi:hypothetical protein